MMILQALANDSRGNKPRNVTIMDVAREAGVSYSTVSRVMNNNPHVRAEKRERVLTAMNRLGYVVNQQARSLAGGRSHVIGLLVPDVGNSYIGQIMRGVDEHLAASQYDLMLYTTHRRKMKESVYVATLTRGMTDGLLLLLPLNPEAYIEGLYRSQFPYVVIDHQGFDDFSPSVIATNWQGAFDATEYLIGLGHRRIAMITGTPELNSAKERLRGFQDALQAHNIPLNPELMRNGDFHQTPSYTAAAELLALPEPPTAIFAASDLSAIGAIDAIRAQGLRIPEDISIVGFDDIPEAAWMHPGLTTVRQPLLDMGRRAVQLLFEYIESPDRSTKRIEINTELIIRESCQPV